MANEMIKGQAKRSRVYLWEVAERLGMQDSALSRKLRKELSEGDKLKLLSIIGEISESRRLQNDKQ